MKNNLFLLLGFTVSLLFVTAKHSSAQGIELTNTVSSTDGYDVQITMRLTEVIAPNGCPNGYNFNIRYEYDIEFIGASAPNSMYTLQGNLSCGSSTNNFFNLQNQGGTGTGVSGGNSWRPISDCQTATIESLECNMVDVTIHGPGIPHQVVSLELNGSLPVEWLDFTVNNENDAVVLNWSTGSELNNDYFTVEQSIDGENWKELSEIMGAGNKNTRSDYKWVDYNPSIGNTYYRIKQTDFDGRYDYSEIKSFNLKGSDQLKVYPVPANDVLNIVSASTIKQDVKVLSSYGQNMTSKVEFTNNNKALNISDLPTGVYMLKVGDQTTRFQKL